MKKKYLRLIIVLLFLLVLGASLFFIFYPRKVRPAGKVYCYFHLYSPTLKDTLSDMLNEFESFYPDIELVPVIEPYQDMKRKLFSDLESAGPERVSLTVLSGQDITRFAGDRDIFSPWISYDWNLYYNQDVLAELGYDKEKLNELSMGSLKDFIAEFTPHLKSGQTLFSLGANYYLSWLIWVQYLQLLENKGVSPKGYAPEEWMDGIKSIESLIEAGVFNPDYKEKNFAWSQLAVGRGEALFVLSSSTIYSTYPPLERASITSIPVPGTVAQGWEIGSNIYLELVAAEEAPEETVAAGTLLKDYFRSDGIRQRYLKKTGILFLPEIGRKEKLEIPSLTHKSMDLEVQDLLKYTDQNP